MKKQFITITLSVLFYILISTSSQVLAKEIYLAEDINKDGIVDIIDISLMAKHYNTNTALYDLNKDSIVDIYDLTIMSKSIDNTSYGLGIVTGEYINLRTTPDQTNISNITAQLYQYDRFNILDDLGEWYKVSYEDNDTIRVGYIYALYTLPLRDNCFDSYLGFISSKNESTLYNNGTTELPTSVRNPGTISNNPGDEGGKSYGQYQLSSALGTVDIFLGYLKASPEGITFYDKLNNAKILDGNKFGPNFDKVWSNIATTSADDFFEFQRKFVKIEYYDKAETILKNEDSFDMNTKSFALNEVLWSTAVQYGIQGDGTATKGAIDIFREAGLEKQENQLIINIYDIKIKHAETVSDNAIKNALITRAKSEKADVLYMFNSYK